MRHMYLPLLCSPHSLDKLDEYTAPPDSVQRWEYDYRLSTNTKCMAAYPSTKKMPHQTASPTASDHSARLLNPNELRMAEPGTSMSRPYFLSTNESV